MKKLISSLMTMAALLSIGGSTLAAPILWVGDSAGNLGTVDVATGNVNVIGNMGQIMTDIAFDPNGNLFGITANSLYSIDKNTGSSNLIGSLGTWLNSLVFGSDGTLYGASNNLWTINTNTGTASLIGGSEYFSSGDLAFIENNLYLSGYKPAGDGDGNGESKQTGGDFLIHLNTTTGAGTFLDNSIGFYGVYGLATDNNIDLYGVSGTDVIGINTLTGEGNFLVNYTGQGLDIAYGSAFFEEACSGNCTSVPEPGSMSLAMLALGLLGMVRLRKRTNI